MSTEQIITKKIKRKLIIEEEEFDITRLKELPQSVVNYCFSFLSTPETLPYRITGGNDGLREHDEFYSNLAKKTLEEQKAWRNRPAAWWEQLVKDETFRVWEIKYYPAVAARFQKMSNAHLKKVTEPLQFHAFNGIWSEGNKSKKHWIRNFKRIVRGTSSVEIRKKILKLIILSKK